MDWQEKRGKDINEFFSALDGSAEAAEPALGPNEKELLREMVDSLRTIRYGSILLVIHEGRLVEVNKTVRIRRTRTSQNGKE